MSPLLLALIAAGGTGTDPDPDPPGSYSRTDTGVIWYAMNNGAAYGTRWSDGAWVSTTDGETLTPLTGNITDHGGVHPIDMTFGGGYMWLMVPGQLPQRAGSLVTLPGGTGKVWRAPLGDFDNWTDVTPTGWDADTCGRNAVLAHNGTTLLVGQYGYYTSDGKSKVHRTTDNGATWTSWNPGGATRHVHAVHFDPTSSTTAWVTVGDSPGSPRGIYRSTDSGATWTLIATNEYPIEFGWLSTGKIVGEGDGINRAHIVGLAPGASTFTGDITPAMAEAATGMTDWRGTTRALAALPGDRLFYTTTAELGATGTRHGIWSAVPSGATWDVELLEELPAAWTVMGSTLQLSNGALLSFRYRFTLPPHTT